MKLHDQTELELRPVEVVVALIAAVLIVRAVLKPLSRCPRAVLKPISR